MATRSSTDPTPKRAYLRAEVRREQILDAAAGVFAQRGPDASLDAIAAAAGVERTVLYYYFPSKTELFLAVFEAQQDKMLAHIGPAILAAQTVQQRARAGTEAALSYARANPDSCRILFGDLQYADPELAAAGRATHENLMAAIAQMTAPHFAQAGLDPYDNRIRIGSEMMLGGLVAIWRWSIEHPEVDRDTIADTTFDLVWALVNSALSAPNSPETTGRYANRQTKRPNAD